MIKFEGCHTNIGNSKALCTLGYLRSWDFHTLRYHTTYILCSRVNSCKTTRTWHIPWIKFWRFSFKRKTVEKSYFEGLIALSRVSILQKNTFRWTVEQPRCLQAINHSTKASFCHPLRKRSVCKKYSFNNNRSFYFHWNVMSRWLCPILKYH